jgi:hypothetical protein
MTRIAITAAAYAAIAATLPPRWLPDEPPDRLVDGRIWVWLPNAILERLQAARGPRDSYSDVILRAVDLTGERQ